MTYLRLVVPFKTPGMCQNFENIELTPKNSDTCAKRRAVQAESRMFSM